jgi:hypothetical protein
MPHAPVLTAEAGGPMATEEVVVDLVVVVDPGEGDSEDIKLSGGCLGLKVALVFT